MLKVALLRPEIPPNTGNIMRLCAATGCELHLIGPLGFRLDEASLKRAGMDYRHWAQVFRYADWDAFCASEAGQGRIIPVSTRGAQRLDQLTIAQGDLFLFGAEGSGLPAEILAQAPQVARIPMTAQARSLNLANSVAIVLYGALATLGYPGLE
ncbi:putative RNA methyltransferase [Magnetofaba australis IT-1]|uniref:tRNA (cytidine(34)-2'-O)-methyltransferase n=1 Tax=Magnetofaba australis IT-1 TaxID=1434232 RepID=A0A1Y2K876_9PROT|nr:tRNA (cytidine(34)-2'-O)-methyltransferase [Magnetofaba australis]OSM06951.1 putative RNA methyltransferase [Magnetofaba australis IT-1]